MAGGADLGKVAQALRELHRALLERARRDYEREWNTQIPPGDLLQKLAGDPHFAWLRALSERMVDVDLLREAGPAPTDPDADAVRRAVEQLVAVPATPAAANPFAARYWPYVRDDPRVAMAHAAVKLAMASWPSH